MKTSQTATADVRSTTLNQREAAELLGVDRTTVWRLTQTDPSFPRPAILGPRTLRWRRDELEDWFDARQRGGLPRAGRSLRL